MQSPWHMKAISLISGNICLEQDVHVDLGSDQTSLHNPFAGGYYPAGVGFQEANRMMVEEPERFKEAVYESLRRHVKAINGLTAKGMYFWDYGNAFLLESGRAGADIFSKDGIYRYQSYVQAIMGPSFLIMDLVPFAGYAPLQNPEDLATADRIARRNWRNWQRMHPGDQGSAGR